MTVITLPLYGMVLEIGGGTNPIPGTFNMDVLDSPKVNLRHDATLFPWPIRGETFDCVYSGYCIEHVPWKDVRRFVSEMYRVLRKPGTVCLLTSNTLEQCRWVVEHGVDETASMLLFGGQEFPNHAGVHKNALSPAWAKKLLEDAGFVNVDITPNPNTPTDMIITATKLKGDGP